MSIIKRLVDLQLKEAGWEGIDYNYVIKNPIEDGLEWYERYYWKTEEDYNRFKKKAEEIIKKEVANKSGENVRLNFGWFDMTWGLSNHYLEFVKKDIDVKKEKHTKKNKSKKDGGKKSEKTED